MLVKLTPPTLHLYYILNNSRLLNVTDGFSCHNGDDEHNEKSLGNAIFHIWTKLLYKYYFLLFDICNKSSVSVLHIFEILFYHRYLLNIMKIKK